MINLIVCIARNRAIGWNGGLLYRLRADLRQFKAITTGHTVIMGRRTFDSLPKGALPNRRNIVLSHTCTSFPNAECFASLPEALAHCAPDEQVFIIGGASVYAEALPLCQRLYLTEVDDTPAQADTFFPEIDRSQWVETARESHQADADNERPFAFVTLERKP